MWTDRKENVILHHQIFVLKKADVKRARFCGYTCCQQLINKSISQSIALISVEQNVTEYNVQCRNDKIY